jgi:uncharacterized protein
MQLRERLSYVTGTSRAPVAPPAAVLPQGVERYEGRLGAVYFRERYLPLDKRHGHLPLEAALSLDDDLVARLSPGLERSHLRGAAFLDIETTGLSGGTGTYAFLVGVGTFEGFSFRVRQFFLPGPAQEAAMLAAVRETLDRCEALVTFNGKSFDLPQLATRYALMRLPPLSEELPHVDLLHPARRLFGRRLESCRLSELERELLGVKRFGDVPSWMIPGLYFAYVRRAAASGLHPVFEHNETDVLSMVAFLAHLNQVAGCKVEADAERLLAVAKWDEARGRQGGAMGLYREAWSLDANGDWGAEAVWRLCRLVRRGGEWRRCYELWEAELSATTAIRRRIRALIELAKLDEHRRDDVAKALERARLALALLDAAGLQSQLLLTRSQLVHRLARLERRGLA